MTEADEQTGGPAYDRARGLRVWLRRRDASRRRVRRRRAQWDGRRRTRRVRGLVCRWFRWDVRDIRNVRRIGYRRCDGQRRHRRNRAMRDDLPGGNLGSRRNPATGDCGCEYTCNKVSDADPIDPSFTDDNCDGTDGVVAQCVFVSATLGSMAGAGTREHPTVSIARGIDIARSNGLAAVCVSGETYNEAVTVASGVSVYGGFDATNASFPFRRSASAVTQVIAPGIVFDVPLIDAETHLEGLKIRATTPSAPGASAYGVRLGGGTGRLFVRYDAIDAGKGADGGNGADGTPPSPVDGAERQQRRKRRRQRKRGRRGRPAADLRRVRRRRRPRRLRRPERRRRQARAPATAPSGGRPRELRRPLRGVTGNSTGGTGAPCAVNGAAGPQRHGRRRAGHDRGRPVHARRRRRRHQRRQRQGRQRWRWRWRWRQRNAVHVRSRRRRRQRRLRRRRRPPGRQGPRRRRQLRRVRGGGSHHRIRRSADDGRRRQGRQGRRRRGRSDRRHRRHARRPRGRRRPGRPWAAPAPRAAPAVPAAAAAAARASASRAAAEPASFTRASRARRERPAAGGPGGTNPAAATGGPGATGATGENIQIN